MTMGDAARPELHYADLKDTCETLQLWTQVVGKVRLALSPFEPQWANVPLYPTGRGVSTSTIPHPSEYYDFAMLDNYGKEFRERLSDVPMETIEKYLHSLYRVQPDFVYSVSRDFAKSCQTPMLVLPDDVTAHTLQGSIDIA